MQCLGFGYIFCDLIRWSMITMQLPGRMNNENKWNMHLKKQLRLESLHDEDTTFASSVAMRHMAKWETTHLEVEAHLSILLSSTTTTTSATTSSSSSSSLSPSTLLWTSSYISETPRSGDPSATLCMNIKVRTYWWR
jgi:hypothetical protein